MQKRNLSRSPSAPVFDCLWSVRIIADAIRSVKKNHAQPLEKTQKTGNIVRLPFEMEVFPHEKISFPDRRSAAWPGVS